MGFLGGGGGVGLIFGPGIFMGFVGTPMEFFGGCDFCLHRPIRLTQCCTRHLKSGVLPPLRAIALTYFKDLFKEKDLTITEE